MVGRRFDPNASGGPRRSREPERRAPGASRAIGSRFTYVVASAMLLVTGAARAENPALPPIPIALADLDYSDSSGEVQDQSAKHEALLRAFVDLLRRDLAKSDRYRVVALACSPVPCSARRSDPTRLLGAARDAGAVLLLYGGIHKMSTLVQWARVQVVDVRTDKLVLDRLLTFRGDDETAWQRAEAFLAADLEQSNLLDRDRDESAAVFHGREHP